MTKVDIEMKKIEKWYSANESTVDNLVDIVINKIKLYTSIPKHVEYAFSFDEDQLKTDLIKYLYNQMR